MYICCYGELKNPPSGGSGRVIDEAMTLRNLGLYSERSDRSHQLRH